MPRVGLEPTISAGERPKTYALNRAATGTGRQVLLMDIIERYNQNYVHSTVLICTKHTKIHTNSEAHEDFCKLQYDLSYVEACLSFRHKISCLNVVMSLTDTNFVYYSNITQWHVTYEDC